jgi:hypothetical protein
VAYKIEDEGRRPRHWSAILQKRFYILQMLPVRNLKITASSDVAPSIVVHQHRRFGETGCLALMGKQTDWDDRVSDKKSEGKQREQF